MIRGVRILIVEGKFVCSIFVVMRLSFGVLFVFREWIVLVIFKVEGGFILILSSCGGGELNWSLLGVDVVGNWKIFIKCWC